MRGLWKRIWLAVALGLATTAWLGGCTAAPTALEQDIVFSVADSGEAVRFGLVNADGSGLDYWRFRQPKHRYTAFPVWSPDKTKIVYLNTVYPFTGGAGDLLCVDVAQAEAEYICAETETRAWRIVDRPRWTPDGEWWLVVTSNLDIRLVNPETCGTDQVLVHPSDDRSFLSPDLSVRNELVYGVVRLSEAPQSLRDVDLGWILIKDLNTGESRELGRGMVPSWSPDGEWIVLTRQNGLYLVRRDGSEERMLLQVVPWWTQEHVTTALLRAAWSPDGQWIVYSKMVQRDGGSHFDIFKLNVNTGEEVKIAEDGGSPHWHWEPKPIASRSQ